MKKPVLGPQVFHLCDTRSSERLRSPVPFRENRGGQGQAAAKRSIKQECLARPHLWLLWKWMPVIR